MNGTPTIEVATGADSYRAATEDRVGVFDHASGRVIVVADGVGGRCGGAAAAEAALRMVGEAVPGMADVADADGWCRVLAGIDRRIAADPTAGETTLVVAGVTAAGLGGASVGDSGAWLISANEYRDLTGGQYRKPWLGFGAALPMPFRYPRPLDGTLLVATDGLLKYSSAEAICRVVRSTESTQAPRALFDLVRLKSGALQDDVAVALCRVRAVG